MRATGCLKRSRVNRGEDERAEIAQRVLTGGAIRVGLKRKMDRK